MCGCVWVCVGVVVCVVVFLIVLSLFVCAVCTVCVVCVVFTVCLCVACGVCVVVCVCTVCVVCCVHGVFVCGVWRVRGAVCLCVRTDISCGQKEIFFLKYCTSKLHKHRNLMKLPLPSRFVFCHSQRYPRAENIEPQSCPCWLSCWPMLAPVPGHRFYSQTTETPPHSFPFRAPKEFFSLEYARVHGPRLPEFNAQRDPGHARFWSALAQQKRH